METSQPRSQVSKSDTFVGTAAISKSDLTMLTPTTACLGIAVAAAGITLVMLRARRRQERRTAMVDADPGPTTDEPLRRLRKCEAILARRVSACRLVLILEAAVDIHNVTTVLRTAECLGLQEVWIIHPRVGSKRKGPDLGAASLDGSRGNAAARMFCQTCEKELPAAAFSHSQRQRRDGTERCRECVRHNRGAAAVKANVDLNATGDGEGEQGGASTYRVARASAEWLDVRTFADTKEAIACARARGMELWYESRTDRTLVSVVIRSEVRQMFDSCSYAG